MAPKVDLVVLTYGQEEYTQKCFDTILEHTEDYRLVWVDNGSFTKSRKKVMESFLKHEHKLPIWSEENLGFVHGINLALEYLTRTKKTEAEYIGILNNDIEVTQYWLTKMIKVLEENKSIGAVGPVSSAASSIQGWEYLFPNISIPFNTSLHGLETNERAKVLHEKFGDKYVEAPMGITCPMVAFFCTLFRKEVFNEVGFLDSSYGVGYGDDDDFCRRIYDCGYKVAVSIGTYVFHNHRTTFNANFQNDVIRNIRRKNKAFYDKKFAKSQRIERGQL